METTSTPGETMMKAQPQKEHGWLEKLVGEWTYEGEAPAEPGKPPEKFSGTETVRSLGGLWFVAEGRGTVPGGDGHTTIATVGYDPQKRTYVGTWIGSMMNHLWVYERGDVDATERVLTLEAEGPSMTEEGKTARYRDVIEFRSDDERILTGNVLGNDGKWEQMMSMTYRRKR